MCEYLLDLACLILDRFSGFSKIAASFSAGIAQLVEHNLAKVGVASSSLVSRSISRLVAHTLGHYRFVLDEFE